MYGTSELSRTEEDGNPPTPNPSPSLNCRQATVQNYGVRHDIIPTTLYTEIVVERPQLLGNGEDNGVTQKIYFRDDGLEFFAMIDSGCQDINFRKYVLRQYKFQWD